MKWKQSSKDINESPAEKKVNKLAAHVIEILV